ncbi:MAG: hypothetical protein JXA57_02690 [Armatimonadetes bacterium]|nr:hypothetical protein [Armatimonadota bacterium]
MRQQMGKNEATDTCRIGSSIIEALGGDNYISPVTTITLPHLAAVR